MTDFIFRFVLFAALYFIVVWCLFGAWTWYERERLWNQVRRQ